jgi:hypothetical protein
MFEIFICAYGLRWCLWEYKLFEKIREKLSEKSSLIKKLAHCPYCQMIECVLFIWILFEVNNIIHLHLIIGLGMALWMGWLAWVISLLEDFLMIISQISQSPIPLKESDIRSVS